LNHEGHEAHEGKQEFSSDAEAPVVARRVRLTAGNLNSTSLFFFVFLRALRGEPLFLD
jgi:hypothetical protein